jgi:hypothetical protein
MRQLIIMLAATGFIGTTVGCCLTTGVCDCDHSHPSYAPAPGVVPGTVAPKPEAIREMPKPVDSGKLDQ